jgi:hypothetical protein
LPVIHDAAGEARNKAAAAMSAGVPLRRIGGPGVSLRRNRRGY